MIAAAPAANSATSALVRVASDRGVHPHDTEQTAAASSALDAQYTPSSCRRLGFSISTASPARGTDADTVHALSVPNTSRCNASGAAQAQAQYAARNALDRPAPKTALIAKTPPHGPNRLCLWTMSAGTA